MGKNNSFRKAFHHLKSAKEYFDDAVRDSPRSIAGVCSKKYSERLSWIERDFATNTQLPTDMLEDFKKELNTDILFFESLSQKALQLTQRQKETLELILDNLISGEEITVAITA